MRLAVSLPLQEWGVIRLQLLLRFCVTVAMGYPTDNRPTNRLSASLHLPCSADGWNSRPTGCRRRLANPIFLPQPLRSRVSEGNRFCLRPVVFDLAMDPADHSYPRRRRPVAGRPRNLMRPWKPTATPSPPEATQAEYPGSVERSRQARARRSVSVVDLAGVT